MPNFKLFANKISDCFSEMQKQPHIFVDGTNNYKPEMKIQTLEERVAEKYIFSFSHDVTEGVRETNCKVTNSEFWYLNRSDSAAFFSINERDDGKGMHVKIDNVKVVPLKSFVLLNPPEWVKWMLSKLFKSC